MNGTYGTWVSVSEVSLTYVFLWTLSYTYPKYSLVTVSGSDDGEGDVQIGQAVWVGFWYLSL